MVVDEKKLADTIAGAESLVRAIADLENDQVGLLTEQERAIRDVTAVQEQLKQLRRAFTRLVKPFLE